MRKCWSHKTHLRATDVPCFLLNLSVAAAHKRDARFERPTHQGPISVALRPRKLEKRLESNQSCVVFVTKRNVQEVRTWWICQSVEQRFVVCRNLRFLPLRGVIWIGAINAMMCESSQGEAFPLSTESPISLLWFPGFTATNEHRCFVMKESTSNVVWRFWLESSCE